MPQRAPSPLSSPKWDYPLVMPRRGGALTTQLTQVVPPIQGGTCNAQRTHARSGASPAKRVRHHKTPGDSGPPLKRRGTWGMGMGMRGMRDEGVAPHPSPLTEGVQDSHCVCLLHKGGREWAARPGRGMASGAGASWQGSDKGAARGRWVASLASRHPGWRFRQLATAQSASGSGNLARESSWVLSPSRLPAGWMSGDNNTLYISQSNIVLSS